MATRKEKPSTQSQDEGKKPYDGPERCPSSSPSSDGASRESSGVDEPSQERGGLRWIPTPVAPPDYPGLECSKEKAEGQEGKAEGEGLSGQPIQHLQRGEAVEEGPETSSLELPVLEEKHQGGAKVESKGRHPQQGKEPVEPAPPASDDRGQTGNSPWKADPGESEEADDGEDEGAEGRNFVAALSQKVKQDPAPNDEGRRLVKIG